ETQIEGHAGYARSRVTDAPAYRRMNYTNSDGFGTTGAGVTISRRDFTRAAAGVLAGAVVPAAPPQGARPRPSPSQLAWQADELAVFLHFGVNTFTDREWGDGREVTAACRSEGLRAGLYLSPWDRNAPVYGDSPRYNDFYCDQLTELLTRYGPISEVWFDGANGEGPNGRRQVYDWPRMFGLVR